MTATLNEDLVEAIATIGTTTWSGRTYRHTTASRDPLSGEGARRGGGRYNPTDLFPTVYLGQPVEACMRELEQLANRQHLSVEDFLSIPRVLHTIDLIDLEVLDLTNPDTQDTLGLDQADLEGDWPPCQAVGHATWFLEFHGVLAPSAVGAGVNLALFEHRTPPAHFSLGSSAPLDYATYETLRGA
ncbi:RES domain-containing protein [Candidatus Rhodoblastus alkanivorans]|uniref:RES domain-containing protein n=1 Tax=Candidatus Rhodoblastus alkanivorans TaxID=2954117 RepID=A0ABS9ZEC7_9HYPH|nr:RES domain-containing protein [Candidatus Rhodoblastus alkanivorans]MCI4685096.1 RES domain-containing protein [Candidatus Rhodoblastus alkanivorans]